MQPGFDQNSKHEAELQAVIRLGYMCNYDPEHANRVAYLTLRMFDQLKDLHRLGDEERFWLQCASILHDIGMVEGAGAHHKTTLQIILGNRLLPFSNRQRTIIGSIARYHRKALPALTHDHYAALSAGNRLVVNKLAALLRLGSGMAELFRGECDLKVELKARKVKMVCVVTGALPASMDRFPPADLFELTYRKRLFLFWEQKPCRV